MSNVDDNEDGSDEDMFSPKKNRCKIDSAVVQPVIRPPGCKDRLVNTFKHMLTGVPPPPDYTNPDFHLDKMLTQWKENQNYAWNEVNNKANGTAERDNCTLGLCLNTDDSCEELELLGRQICERYIWNETNAVTSNVYVKLTQSAKKRRKTNGWGLSPRTRISYLTRRMTTFQKDNIAAAVASNKTAQILVAKGDVKKGSAGKNNLKGKRALFLSPDNQNKYRTPEQGKDRKVRRLQLNSSPPLSNSSKCSAGGENTKSTEKRRCSRSLFSSKDEQVSDKKSTPQNQNQPSNALSSQHRQKMLWAVSNALKAVKIRMTDPEFKTYAAPLFKATAEKWRESVNSPAGDKKASTSDAMLAAAKSLVEGVTGRKMSPKSAKKNPTLRMRTKTPDKLGKRDENNPPSIVNPATLIKDPVDAGVFPLEHVDILAEKLDPGGNTNSLSIPVTNPSRKRKLDDERHIEPTSILLSPRALSMRTPSKANGLTPKKLTFHPSLVDGTPSKHANDSPLAKKRKLASLGTPTKLQDEEEMVSPRLLRRRTPLKIPESPEVICSRSQGVSPMKLRSTPSKQLHHSKNVENSSSTVSSASKFKGEVKGILTPPRVLRTRTPSRAAPSSEVCNTKRTPKKVLFASYDEKEISSNPDELIQSDLEFPPERKTSQTMRTALSLSSNNIDKSKTFQTDDDREAKKLTSVPKNHVSPKLFGDESPADPLPPVLRPEGRTMRRSSRRLSVELPPPVLEMEISDSPPLATLKR